MRVAFASAGMVSAAVLLGCDGPASRAEEKGAELRLASFRGFAAADRLAACGAGDRPEVRHELQRFETLKDFARRRGARAGYMLWQGQNAWNGTARRALPSACPGEAEYRRALAAFGASLDGLANGIMAYED